FTTNLSGYQEVFTDPSYLGQVVVMTAPMIGNYGINPDDVESDRPRVAGVVVRELSATAALGERPSDEARAALAASPSMDGLDLASAATIPRAYSEGPADARHHIVAFDFGMKRNILRLFVRQGCRVTVVP